MTHDKDFDEEQLNQFGRSLKKLQIPESLRESNRKRIIEALDSIPVEPEPSVSWFKRRITIPFPIAAGFLLVFCLQLIFSTMYFSGWGAEYSKTEKGVTQHDLFGQSEDSTEPYYSEQGVYVAGIGFVEKSKTFYKME